MTSGELGGELGDELRAPAAEPALAAVSAGLDIPEILDLTDRLLDEPGRRSHLFSWLKRPGDGPADWLAVDAYYPVNKVVVVSRETAGRYRKLFAEIVPAHGLRLLEVNDRELVGGREAARRTLERSIAELGPLGTQAVGGLASRQAPTTRDGARPAPRWLSSSAADRPRRLGSSAGDLPGPPTAARERQLTSVLAGFALAAVIGAEVYAAVARAGFNSGHVLFGFGLALDACARGLGTIAARRGGSSDWAWWCALGGSPVVAWFALFQGDGPVRTEPAPLAGLISVLALLVLAVALLAAAF